MLIGHQRIWNFLIRSHKQNKLAHAYLFLGSSQVGKRTLALEFSRWLLCQNKKRNQACRQCRSCQDIEKNCHPDFMFLAPRQEERDGVVKTFDIGIDEIRAVQHQLSLSPYSSEYKIAIIDEVSFLTREAANAFLKTLEEPSGKSLIFLISSFHDWLLPTIVSRCQLVKFLPVAQKEIFEALAPQFNSEARAKRAARLSAGRPGRAVQFLREPEIFAYQEQEFKQFQNLLKADLPTRFEMAKEMSQNVGQAQETLSQWLLWVRDGILRSCFCSELALEEKEAAFSQGQSALKLAREIQKALGILGNSSFNARLALEIFMTKTII